MSWSTTLEVSMDQNVAYQLEKHFEAGNAREHGGPQIEAAIDAVLSLITVVARPQDKIQVNLSGHYNPGNEPVEGWADNLISINLYQRVEK